QELDPGLLRELLSSGYGLVRNPSARLAWRQEKQDYLMLFASGEHCILPLHLRPLLPLICTGRYHGPEQLAPWRADAEALELLQQVLGKGELLPEQDGENEDDDD